jgi:hypothetical protein
MDEIIFRLCLYNMHKVNEFHKACRAFLTHFFQHTHVERGSEWSYDFKCLKIN